MLDLLEARRVLSTTSGRNHRCKALVKRWQAGGVLYSVCEYTCKRRTATVPCA